MAQPHECGPLDKRRCGSNPADRQIERTLKPAAAACACYRGGNSQINRLSVGAMGMVMLARRGVIVVRPVVMPRVHRRCISVGVMRYYCRQSFATGLQRPSSPRD
jgi:hypothetical protein